MATTTLNGKASRKTLATQLDRLDAILDGLADNLAAAVAQAVKEVLAQALEQVEARAAAQALSRPEVLEAIKSAVAQAIPAAQATTTPPVAAAPVPAPEPTLAAVARRWGLSLREKAVRVRDGSRAWLAAAWRSRKRLLAVAGVGLGAGVAALLAGPLVSAGLVGLVGVAVAWLASDTGASSGGTASKA